MSAREDIMAEEGWKPYAYQDTRGFWTIGYGFLIDQRGGDLPKEVGAFWLDLKLAAVQKQLDQHLSWWRGRSPSVQDALEELAYQMGLGTSDPPTGLLGFRNGLSCLQAGDFDGAKRHFLDSAWAKQTPARAQRVTAKFVG